MELVVDCFQLLDMIEKGTNICVIARQNGQLCYSLLSKLLFAASLWRPTHFRWQNAHEKFVSNALYRDCVLEKSIQFRPNNISNEHFNCVIICFLTSGVFSLAYTSSDCLSSILAPMIFTWQKISHSSSPRWSTIKTRAFQPFIEACLRTWTELPLFWRSQ